MLTKALEKRGWLQKYESTRTRMQPYSKLTFETNFHKSLFASDDPCRIETLAHFLSLGIHAAGIVTMESKSLGNIIQEDGSLNSKALVFAFLRHVPPDFIWDCRNDFVEWDSSVKHHVLLNRFERPSVYTSKVRAFGYTGSSK